MDKIVHTIADRLTKQEGKMVIGISGHGASGKTTFARKLLSLLGNGVNYINTDPYIVSSAVRKHSFIEYEYENEKHQSKMTACHPDAHHVFALDRDIRMVRKGMDFYTLDVPYDPSRLISSHKNLTIVEGMSVAFSKPDLYDLKIYFYTNGETELMRRGIRDVNERGMKVEYLQRTHDERRIQYEVFMHPKSEHFDVVVRNSDEGYCMEKNSLIMK
ncbi:uridine kinase family protein [Rossellomorea vietnamensis]|uniref:uridine kinase family protein n=1 Tax=Rossellomorea vietnamensis TaxID=218284 RepID=UPI001E367806|nr:phosphoribulokinase [Rossellomorea vietnamensis]MCC5803610.1 phosphoribulokinase [Rossellomorea vietnamensis]